MADQPNKTQIDNELDAIRNEMKRLQRELDKQQRIAYVAGLFQGDVTIRTLFESLGEGVIVVDMYGTIILTNHRVEEMFGYSYDEAVGHSLNIFLPGQLFSKHAKHVRSYFNDPHIRRMGQGLDLSGKRKDGLEFPVEISLSFLETEAGPLGLAFITDITLRKQAEHALELRNEELDAFGHTVAHDLNASLSLIVGYSETLLNLHKTLSDEDLESYLERLAQNGRKLSNITNELLVFATMRKGETPQDTLDMAGIVREACNRMTYLIKETQAELVFPDHFPSAIGYAPWVEEIWFNYINNALKYGGQPPHIELGAQTLDNGFVEFWVKDNGTGLTPDQQTGIFLPTTRINLPQAKGFGLGLSIVKRMAEKLGGQVSVSSEVGKGSVFSFTLPDGKA